MFYKEYCQKNRDLDENIIDDNIESLEKLWGDDIFSPNTPDWKKKFTAFLGTVFLTGSDVAKYNGNKKYRKYIQEYLRNEYNNNYHFSKIKYEFNVFLAVKIFINKFNISYQGKERSALEAENSNKFSITYQTAHTLNALRYPSVMPALVNIILKNYLKQNHGTINIDTYKEFISMLKYDKNHSNPTFEEIHKCANNLRKLSLLSENHKIPREFAVKIIKKINYNSFDISCLYIPSETSDIATEEFKRWTNRWYKGSDDFRIKLLFLNLIRSNKTSNKLEYYNGQIIFNNVDKLQLDHFEPKTPDNNNPNNYFIPPIGKNREDYVEQLGNFMILDKDKNSSLGNSPAESSIEFYKKNIGSHWIIHEINTLLKKHHKTKNNYKIPTEEFFNERKKNLQNYFFNIINMKYDEDNTIITPIV